MLSIRRNLLRKVKHFFEKLKEIFKHKFHSKANRRKTTAIGNFVLGH
jgi:hypothetical protein